MIDKKHVYRAVVTVLTNDGQSDGRIEAALLDRLRGAGLRFAEADINHCNGVVEGIVDHANLHGLERLRGVAYVRHTQTYRADLE